MILSFARVIKMSFQDMARNIWLSLVTVIIMILALIIVNMLIVVQVVGSTATSAIREKVDVSLFISENADESEILELKQRVREFPEVKEVTYVSKEEAMMDFKKKHEDNPEILSALRELGKNPLTPSLIIKPKTLDDFETLIKRISAINSEIIESRNFANYKMMIDKINSITKRVSDAGLLLSLIFTCITLLVVYNSVRMAIYTHKKQIIIMKLVGASNVFIQTPYLVSSFIYTVISLLFVVVVFYPFLNLLQPYLEAFFIGYQVDLVAYFYSNIFTVFGVQLLAASSVNMLASLVAVRKYSRV